jgi:hypothetical protein
MPSCLYIHTHTNTHTHTQTQTHKHRVEKIQKHMKHDSTHKLNLSTKNSRDFQHSNVIESSIPWAGVYVCVYVYVYVCVCVLVMHVCVCIVMHVCSGECIVDVSALECTQIVYFSGKCVCGVCVCV